MRKAIFIPSEIYTNKPCRKGQLPIHSYEDSNGKYEMFMTGNLDRAIKKGYEIYVCLSSPFSIHDIWWTDKVKRENILEPAIEHAFISDEFDSDEDIPHPGSYPRFKKLILGGYDCPLLLGMWRRLYKKFEVEWPSNVRTWDEARAVLAFDPDIRMGSDFK